MKAYAKANPHSMGEWSGDSKSRVAHMDDGDFYGSEQSAIVAEAGNLKIELETVDGTTVLRDAVPVLTRYMLAADMPEADRPRYRMLSPGTTSHQAWLSRLVQPNPFYSTRYAAADVCENVVPIVPIQDAS